MEVLSFSRMVSVTIILEETNGFYVVLAATGLAKVLLAVKDKITRAKYAPLR